MKDKFTYGYTLIEVLIATSLGLLLLAGLMQIFVSVKSTYQLQNALLRIQENGRFAIYFLNNNIRMAGYAGCEENNWPVTTENAIRSYVNSNVVAHTDAVIIKRCEQKKIVDIAFFIHDTGRKNATGQSIYGLYEKIFTNNSSSSQEVVTDIETMKIEYGISADGLNVDNYLTANQMQTADWQKIRSVKIALILNSGNNILSQPQRYWFNNKEILPNDRMLHKEWDTYINLRESLNNKA